MKKLISVILTLSILFSFSSCVERADTKTDNLKIMTTIFPFYSFITDITAGVSNVDVEMLIEPGAEVHTYSPDAEDVYNYINSDIFVCIGGESDSWTEDLIKQSSDVRVVKLITGIDVIENDEHEHSADEHIWTSPKNAKILVQKICDELCAFDKTNESVYKNNTQRYIAKLDEIDKKLNRMKGNTLVFEGIFPFAYLAKDYDLKCFSGLDVCDGTSDISAQKLDFLVNAINENDAETVFYTEFSDMKIADKLCSLTKTHKKLLHSCHNVSAEEFESGETYISLMEKNVETLQEVFDVK